MKKALVVLLTLLCTWPSLTAQETIIARRRAAAATGIAFVAPYQTNSQSAGCMACAATALATTAGNGIIACFEYQSATSTFTSFTSSPSATWTTIGSGGSDATNTTQLICGQAIAPSSTITITANVTSFTFLSTFLVAKYSGTPASGSILDTNSTYLVSSGNPSCPAVTTTIANDFVLCIMVQDTGNSGNFTAGSGFTLRTTANANNGWEDKLQATTATVTPTFTSTNVGGVIMVTLAIKP